MCGGDEPQSTVSGTIQDATNGEPLRDVLVQVSVEGSSEGASTRSSDDGTYEIREILITSESYSITAKLFAYNSKQEIQKLNEGINIIDFQLDPMQCKMRSEHSTIQDDSVDVILTLINETEVDCNYNLKLANNGPDPTRPLLSFRSLIDRTGRVEEKSQKVVILSINRNNFNNNVDASQV